MSGYYDYPANSYDEAVDEAIEATEIAGSKIWMIIQDRRNVPDAIHKARKKILEALEILQKEKKDEN